MPRSLGSSTTASLGFSRIRSSISVLLRFWEETMSQLLEVSIHGEPRPRREEPEAICLEVHDCRCAWGKVQVDCGEEKNVMLCWNPGFHFMQSGRTTLWKLMWAYLDRDINNINVSHVTPVQQKVNWLTFKQCQSKHQPSPHFSSWAATPHKSLICCFLTMVGKNTKDLLLLQWLLLCLSVF